MRDNRRDSIFEPVYAASCAKVVEQKDRRFEGGLIRLLFSRPGGGIPTRLNSVEQRLEIEERAVEPLAQDLLKCAYGKMRLADAVVADDEKPRFAKRGQVLARIAP